MRVLLLNDGKDNGGNGSALRRAMLRNTDWHVRHIRRQPSFLGYERDIEWPRKLPLPPAVLTEWKRADVVILLGGFRTAQSLPGYDRKPKVMYHLGQQFRDSAESFMARCRAEGIPQLVTTFDLLAYGPDLHWLPMVCDTERMERERQAYRPGPKVRVMQSPAARGPNHTDDFLAAMAGVDVDVSLIEGVPWDEALRRKAQADIVFDSFDSWYGLSAIEAMGMGIPVVGGAGPVNEVMEQVIGCVPYLPVARGSLARVVRELDECFDDQLMYGDLGRGVAHRFHAEAKVVERLRPFLEMAMDRAVAA